MVATTEKYLITILLFMFSLTGCSSAIKNATTLPTAEAQTSAPSSQEYRIQPGDELNIKFFYNPELNESQIVRPDGRIALQLASEIVAAGLTPSKLTTVLEKRYADELEKPEITVIVRSFNGQRFFVDGEVSRPGLFTLIGPTTVLDSIVQAGGHRRSQYTYGIKNLSSLSMGKGPQGKARNIKYVIEPNGDSSVLERSGVLDGTEIHPVQQ